MPNFCPADLPLQPVRTAYGTWLLRVASLSVPLLLFGCRHDAFPLLPSGFHEFAYVANMAGNSVTVMDVVHMRTEKTLKVGVAPVAEAVNPVANEVYVVNSAPAQAAGSVSIIDTTSNTVAGTVRVGRQPTAIAVDPAGQRAYVANTGGDSVSVIDLQARRVIATEPMGKAPGSLAIAPDGRALVVANAGSGTVSIFTPAPRSSEPGKVQPGTLSGAPLRLRATFPGCPGASAAVVLPDSSKAFVACSAAHAVLAIGLAAAPGSWFARQDSTLETDHALAMLDVGQDPTNLTVKGDSGEVFVSNRGSDSISEISATTNEVGSTYPIGDQPGAGLVSGASNDYSALWIADSGASSLSLYSIDDGKLLFTIPAGPGPVALAFAAREQLVLAADKASGDVALIRTTSKLGPALFDILPSGASPVAIVCKSSETPKT